MKDLSQLRSEMDGVDRELLRLFEARMAISRQVGEYKAAHDLPVQDTKRENELLSDRMSRLSDTHWEAGARDLFRLLMDLSKTEQACLAANGIWGTAKHVVYQGVSGAYGEEATMAFFGRQVNATGMTRFEDVFKAVADGTADYGVVPVENSSTGAINDVYDLLGQYRCYIVGEQILPIRHCLLGVPGGVIENIAEVYTIDQVLNQCSHYLDQHPEWRQVPYHNTAISAQYVAAIGDPSKAAIASQHAAVRYGLQVLESGIQNRSDNHTRFVVVSSRMREDCASNKVSIFFILRHESGSLYRALGHFTDKHLNLTKIESRPLHGRNWEYSFYVDFEIDPARTDIREVMSALAVECLECRLLGMYTAAKVLNNA